MMDVEEWRDSFEMSSGNNFHSSAMPPSPMSVSTWSCDPSAQLLRLNGLKHKDQKKKKKDSCRHLGAKAVWKVSQKTTVVRLP